MARNACREVVFEDLPRFLDYDKMVDIVLEVSVRFRQATSNWQGMVHILQQGSQHHGQLSVKCLP
ncbi:hypothetical protein DPMN_072314 [Dreissena polymorpha]|uniref:Uncharacterized protein n=1 Tax=Dreissena polymorpha TaxID=45954 RepID=A0A9D4BWQ9_DREPO|nr:hypothetical protein DPMN_072314 [Dreissena polymorpha]